VKISSKPAAQRRPSPLVVGVEINLQTVAAVLVDENGRVVEERESAVPRRTTRGAAAEITKLIVSLAGSRARGGKPITAIGFSVPGAVDPATGRVSIPGAEGAKGWTRVALLPMVEEGLNGAGVDVRRPPEENRARANLSDSAHPAMAIHSRAAALVAGEAWAGSARGKSNVVYLRIGDEIEAGILADRRVVQGAGGFAGAAGWLALSEVFKQEYEAHGCFTAEGSGSPLTRRAIEGWDGGAKSVIGQVIKDNAASLDNATIIRAARGGDALALSAVHETCRWVGRGAANLISVLNPDAVVIGGDVGMAIKPYLDEIRKEAGKWAAPAAARQCRIVSAALGARASLIGAAWLASLKAHG
jgi:glucokinase